MSDGAHNPGELPWSGERFVPQVTGNIRLEHLHRYLLAREYCRGRRVLDIACGEGYGSALLAAVAAGVIGADIAPGAIAHARRRYQHPALHFAVGDCVAIPLLDQSVDVVVSFETIEHHGRHEEMLCEMKRVLRPGGTLIISSPEKHEYSDAPGYKNPFHVRELYRDEFENLLHAHFRHVSLAGQRIKAGSLVWPIDGDDRRSVSGYEAGQATGDVRPIGAPLYLIAAASDGPVPPLPAGLLDGGAFVWSTDHVNAFQSVETHYQAHFRQLSDARAQAEAHAAAAQDAQAASHARLSELESSVAALAAERSWLELALGEEGDALGTMTRERDRVTVALRAMTGELDRQAAELDVMQSSHSWRMTAPFRSLRRVMQRRQPLLQTVRQAGLDTYRALPLSVPTRLKIKDAFFRGFPFLFRRTSTYRAWDSSRRAHARLQAAEALQPDVQSPADGSLPAWFYADAGADYVPITQSGEIDTRIKAIAFYLPQFHPIPENDRWWGKGFTEWTNVSRARPQFAGHYQPHLPGELGFYDLRILDVQRRQIELAKLYGLYGFCYHFYWFGGRRLLRQPLDQLMAHPDMDFPFCLCWANENWTRRWDGREREILIEQQHSPADDRAFIEEIAPILRDPRYIRVDGRPVLVVYRPALLPDARTTAALWRRYCREQGIGDLYLISTHAFDRIEPGQLGFDAAMEFPPNNFNFPPAPGGVTALNPEFQGTIHDYRYLVEHSRAYPPPSSVLFRSVAPMWDNVARRGAQGVLFAHSTPALYAEWLENACRDTEQRLADTPLVFINAWNEWAEGAHLEPDCRHGYAYLQATRDVLRKFPSRARTTIVCVSHDACFHGAQLLALNLARTLSTALHYDVQILLCGDGPLKPAFEGVAPVHAFFPGASTRESRAATVRTLFDGGARIALCNTCVVGDTVELLKAGGFTVVSMVHELPGIIKQQRLESSAAKIARHADRVVFAADVVRDRFIELTGLAPDKAVVRPQGLYAVNRFKGQREVARRQLRTALGTSDEVRVLIGVGYADYRKGVDLFVEVGIELARRRADVVFAWVGHHDADTFARAQARVSEAGLESRFRFPGIANEPDVFFAGADVYLLTSREDPFPAVVQEALDAELPVIGFEGAGGFGEVARRGAGAIVPFADTAAMAAAAQRILEDATERSRLTSAGRRIVDEEYSFVDYARFLVGLGSPTLKVSVIVPNFNYARYLPARLRSILSQTHLPHEIVFLDDCSSDDSVDVAEAVLHGSGVPYRIVQNQTNQGCYRQWLRGLSEITGDLVWIAEADDDCAPTFLASLIPTFDDAGVILAYCQSRQIDDDGREIAPDYSAWTADVNPTKWRHAYVRRGVDEIRDSLAIKNTIPNVSGVLMRRPDLAAIEDRLIGLRNAGDWLVYVHLLESGDIAYVPDALNFHRRHRSSVTIGHGGLNLMRESMQVQQYVLERHRISPEVNRKREMALQTAYEYLGLTSDGPALYKDHDELKRAAADAVACAR